MNSLPSTQPPPTSILTIQPIDASNLHDLNRVDGNFTIDSRLVPYIQDGQIGYSFEPVQPRTKRYPAEKFDWTTFIDNPDKAIYLAYVKGQLAGQIILWKNWNGYGYIEDIAVDASIRRQGIGRRLIERAVT